MPAHPVEKPRERARTLRMLFLDSLCTLQQTSTRGAPGQREYSAASSYRPCEQPSPDTIRSMVAVAWNWRVLIPCRAQSPTARRTANRRKRTSCDASLMLDAARSRHMTACMGEGTSGAYPDAARSPARLLGRRHTSRTRCLVRSQPRSLLPMPKSNNARSRVRPCI